MDNIDLQDLRKKLHSFKKTGLKQVIAILQEITNPKIDQKKLIESKIHKTVRTLTQTEKDGSFTESEWKLLIEKAKEAYQKLKKIDSQVQTTEQPIKQSQNQQQSIPQSQSDNKKQSTDAQNNDYIAQLNLPSNFDQNRLKILSTLIDRFVKNQQNASEGALFCKKLEQELNTKYSGKDQQYKTAMKEIFKYITNDRDGSMRNRLLSGLIDVPTAALLRSEDWTSATVLAVANGIGREILSANDMNHNKKIAQAINKDVALGLCSNCGQKQLKLINEIQTRASDEPSTKFYECLNCGMSETTGG